MVIGIIGNTQGVKMASNPAPNASSMKGPISCVSGLGVTAATAGEPGLNSRNPAGMEIDCAGAFGSIFSGAVAVYLRGGQAASRVTDVKTNQASQVGRPGGRVRPFEGQLEAGIRPFLHTFAFQY